MLEQRFECEDCGHRGWKIEQPKGWRCICPACGVRAYQNKAELRQERIERKQAELEADRPTAFVPPGHSCAIRTDDNNPLKKASYVLGKPTETRADVKAREAEGTVWVKPRDMEGLQDRRKAMIHDRMRMAVDKALR